MGNVCQKEWEEVADRKEKQGGGDSGDYFYNFFLHELHEQ